ncbi:MAG: ImmA/IrrE family metallo-endopeptidase [Phycisphaerales bacterium]|nr:MAG: ImmA/IrrE family metallo-endopeptidase [Phycisphaerales bacterium]
MSTLSFDYEWLEPDGGDGPEVEATFARLRIKVGESVVTEAEHKRSRSVTDRIEVPLYPLAEWIAANWWCLTCESAVLGREWYDRRHSMKSAGYGYVYPDLTLSLEGVNTLLAWKPREHAYANLRYLSAGSERVSTAAIAETLADFIEAVCERLRDQDVRESWLQTEWEAVQTSGGKPDEREFCVVAGWLGLDPYELSDADAESMIHAARQLPAEVKEDTLRSVTLSEARDLAAWIDAARNTPARNVSRSRLEAARNVVHSVVNAEHAWAAGYKLAREVRALWGLSDARACLRDVFCDEPPVEELPGAPVNVDGLVNLGDSAVIVTSKRREESRRFLVARAISELLTGRGTWTLLTSVHTERQQLSRAFAAEFLAPADAIVKRLPARRYLVNEDIVELAEYFQVSTKVIQHQVENHGLATIAAHVA